MSAAPTTAQNRALINRIAEELEKPNHSETMAVLEEAKGAIIKLDNQREDMCRTLSAYVVSEVDRLIRRKVDAEYELIVDRYTGACVFLVGCVLGYLVGAA